MNFIRQDFDQIIGTLSALEADWMDDMAEAIMRRIRSVPVKEEYGRSDIEELINAQTGDDFAVSRFCIGLFLGFSKDRLEGELKERLGNGGIGVQRFNADRETYLDVLEELGLRDAMTATANAQPMWHDIHSKGATSIGSRQCDSRSAARTRA